MFARRFACASRNSSRKPLSIRLRSFHASEAHAFTLRLPRYRISIAESLVSERWKPNDHECVDGIVMFGSKMLRLLATVARSGYSGPPGTQAADVVPAGQVVGGPSRELSRSRIGHDSPAYTRLPLATLRFAV